MRRGPMWRMLWTNREHTRALVVRTLNYGRPGLMMRPAPRVEGLYEKGLPTDRRLSA